MPSRKQRRRRRKGLRHEYEYVYVDSEGREVEVDEEEPTPAPPKAREGKAATKTAARNGKTKGAAQRRPARRPARKIEPPSWKRVGKRALIFGPLMFLVVSLMSRNVSAGSHVLQTAFLLAFFLPFSYVMDSIMYRTYMRRTGGADQGTTSKGGRRGR